MPSCELKICAIKYKQDTKISLLLYFLQFSAGKGF